MYFGVVATVYLKDPNNANDIYDYNLYYNPLILTNYYDDFNKDG